MKITLNGEVKEVSKPCRICELFDNKDHKYMAAKVNNRLRELNYILPSDCDIELLDLTNSSVTTIYQATLRYVTAMAVKNVYPKARIHFNYSVSRSIFATVSGLGHAFLEKNFREIKEEIEKIIAQDYPITRHSLSIAEAEEYAEANYFVQCQQDLTHFSTINQKDVPLNNIPVKFEISNKAKMVAVNASGDAIGDTLVSEVSTLDLSKGTVYLKVCAENKINFNIYTVDVTSY